MAATIRLGSTGADVTTWQGLLSSAGYPVSPSGVFDQPTDAATRAWQSAKGLTVDGVVGPASWGAMTGTAQAGKTDKHAQFGRDTLAAVWKEVTGEEPTLAELQIAGAQAQLESNYGLSQYVNKTIPDGAPGHSSGVINNWGAVQGQPGFMASDTHADGTPYTAYYRIYATPEEGAKDMLKQMTTRRPTSWAHMKAGDIDAWAQQMRTKDPQTNVYGYFEQAADARAKGIEMRIANIAFTLNEPIAARRGGPMPAGGLPSAPEGESEEGAAAKVGGGVLLLGAFLAGALYWSKKRGKR
jgi:hypothetical protein